jgi:hypothetical protein
MKSRLTISTQEDLKNFFLPLFLIFFIISGVITLQTIYGSSAGPKTFYNYSSLFLTKLIFVESFLLFFIMVYELDKRFQVTAIADMRAVLLHIVLFSVFLISHQLICLLFNKLLLINYKDVPFSNLFIKNPLVWYDAAIYPLVMSIFYLIRFRQLSAEKELRALEFESKLVNSQLNELKTKVHPRFLFHSLNKIKTLIANEKFAEANSVLLQFSDVLRATVYNSLLFHSELSEDLSLIKKYIRLQGAKNVFLKTQIEEITDGVIIPGQIVKVMVVELSEFIFKKSGIGFELNLKISQGSHFLEITFKLSPEISGAFDCFFAELSNIVHEVESRLNMAESQDLISTSCNNQGGNIIIRAEVPIIN